MLMQSNHECQIGALNESPSEKEGKLPIMPDQLFSM